MTSDFAKEAVLAVMAWKSFMKAYSKEIPFTMHLTVPSVKDGRYCDNEICNIMTAMHCLEKAVASGSL